MRLRDAERVLGYTLKPIRRFRVGRATVWWCDVEWRPKGSSRVIRGKTMVCSQDDHVDTETGLCEHVDEAERIRAREWLEEYRENFTTVEEFMERLREAADRALNRRVERFCAAFARRSPFDQVRLSAFFEMYWAMNEGTEWVGQCDMDCISAEPLRVALGEDETENHDSFSPIRVLLEELCPAYLPSYMHADPLVLPHAAEKWIFGL